MRRQQPVLRAKVAKMAGQDILLIQKHDANGPLMHLTILTRLAIQTLARPEWGRNWGGESNNPRRAFGQESARLGEEFAPLTHPVPRRM